MEMRPEEREGIEDVLQEVRLCLEGIREGYHFLAQEYPDADPESRLHLSVLEIIDGASTRVARVQEVTRRIRELDPAGYERLDTQVAESRFVHFSSAFREARLGFVGEGRSVRRAIADTIRRLGADAWKESIENWLESIEALLEEYSEIAEGTAAEGLLKMLSKAMTAIAKAISATKGGS